MAFAKTISPNFVKQFRDLEVPWGPVGYCTYKRTYARMTQEGVTEEWYQTVERCCNGLLRIGGIFEQSEIEKLYFYVFNLKCNFSGRALWQLGTETVQKLGGDSLQNCFAGDTEVLTDGGVREIQDILGEKVRVQVLTHEGFEWVETVFKSFGRQNLMKVTLSDGTNIRATTNHEWMKVGKNGPVLDKSRSVFTKDLFSSRVQLPLAFDLTTTNFQDNDYLEGYAHGFVFGDGVNVNDESRVEIFPAKIDMVELVAGYGNLTTWSVGGIDTPVVTGLPAYWKIVPANCTPRYALGFVLGLASADGNVRNTVRIHNKDFETLKQVQRLAQFAGLRCGNPYLDSEVNPFNGQPRELWCITINTHNLTKEHFIRDNQACDLINTRLPKSIGVTKVEADGSEEVYCCVVPGYHNFTLACGVVTFQCWHVAVNDPIDPFTFTFNELMLGGGVGFNITPEYVYEMPAVKHAVRIERVEDMDCDYIVTDNREGWVELLERVLRAFFFTGKGIRYNTFAIRARGKPIKSFGGTASGSEDLVKGIGQIATILGQAVGRKLKPVECLDILNIIGSIVVAGNVRRCIPEITTVHTGNGNVKIRDIKIGDTVQTPEGMKKVTNVFKQGKQKLIAIMLSNKQEFVCTANHKIAVLADGDGEIDWVEAGKLHRGDVVLYNNTPLQSKESGDWLKYWFLGEFHGDGNCYLHKHRGSVSFACSSDPKQVGITDRLYEYLGNLGYDVKESNTGANGHHVKVYDKDFTREMIQYKIPNQAPIIPFWVYEAGSIGRAAYLAGICDADGTPGGYNLCSSKYISYLKELQIIAASLGIVTRIDTRPDRILDATGKIYDNENMLIIMGFESKQLAIKLINPYAIRQIPNVDKPKGDLSIPREMAPSSYEFKHSERHTTRNEQILHANLKEHNSSFWGKVAPLTYIDSYELDDEEETYDIEVEGEHCFFAEGLLVHNSAQIACGSPTDQDFLNAKNWSRFKLPPWRQMSNNSVITGDIASLPSNFWDGYEGKGEPYGLVNLPLCRRLGRITDGDGYRPDVGVVGVNPCGEIPLESHEACNLAELYLPNLESPEEFRDAAILMYKSIKTISMLPFINPKTNSVVTRNRRLGIGVTGYCAAPDMRDNPGLFDAVYNHLEEIDVDYSRQIRSNESIKLTTVKPSGTSSLLPGVPPGVHPEYAPFYIRRITFSAINPLVAAAEANGFKVEPKINIDGSRDYNSMIVEFPVKARPGSIVASELSAVQQLENQMFLQRHWSDNSVSMTCYYKPEELPAVHEWLTENYTDNVKSASFLLHSGHGFTQAPYEPISEERYNAIKAVTTPITRVITSKLDESDTDASTECAGGSCPIK